MSQIIEIKEYSGWIECPDQIDGAVKRWLENEDGEIISVVTGNSKGNMRLNIDGEIRCSLSRRSFAIPCTLSLVAGKTSAEIIRMGKRVNERRGAD